MNRACSASVSAVLRLCFVVVWPVVASIHSGVMDQDRAESLRVAVSQAYAPWLTARVTEVARASGRALSPEARVQLSEIVRTVADDVLAEFSTLLSTDVDAQRENPLHVLRRGSRQIAEFLAAEKTPAPSRDEFEERAMPDDVYGIGPLAWRDLGERVHEAGIEWGAWKAATVLTRRREEGKR